MAMWNPPAPNIFRLFLAVCARSTLCACALCACGSEPAHEITERQSLSSCAIVDTDASTCAEPDAAPSFSQQILPIFDRDCNTCHAPGNPSDLWPLISYQDVYDWRYLIVNDVGGCTMPPANAAPEAGTLDLSDQSTILTWFACGAPNN